MNDVTTVFFLITLSNENNNSDECDETFCYSLFLKKTKIQAKCAFVNYLNFERINTSESPSLAPLSHFLTKFIVNIKQCLREKLSQNISNLI